MKILFLNPHIDAEHELIKLFKERGASVLLSPNSQEAWQMLQLHGSSVDLAIVVREGPSGKGDSGLSFVSRFKKHPEHQDLPYILASSEWGDPDCAAHQNSSVGANAYVKWPFVLEEVESLIMGVTGQPIGSEPTQTRLTRGDTQATGQDQVPPPLPVEGTAAPQTTGATGPATAAGTSATQGPSIQLEPPKGTSQTAAPTSDLPQPDLSLANTGFEFTNVAQDRKGVAGEEDSVVQPPELTESPDAPVAPVEGAPRVAGKPIESGQMDPLDSEVRRQMPYIFGEDKGELPKSAAPSLGRFPQPVGDAVVPGGAADSPDVETLKRYLLLREQDVSALSNQLKAAIEQIETLEAKFDEEKAQSVEFEHLIREHEKKITDLEQEKLRTDDFYREQLKDMGFQLKAKADQEALLEGKIKEADEDMERMKERVRSDIRKIRARERELENRLEILKKDSEVLIGARENKILDLKRKLDITEFNLDLLQERFEKEKELSSEMQDRLEKAAQAVRVAGGFLDEEEEETAGGVDGPTDPGTGQGPNEGRQAS